MQMTRCIKNNLLLFHRTIKQPLWDLINHCRTHYIGTYKQYLTLSRMKQSRNVLKMHMKRCIIVKSNRILCHSLYRC